MYSVCEEMKKVAATTGEQAENQAYESSRSKKTATARQKEVNLEKCIANTDPLIAVVGLFLSERSWKRVICRWENDSGDLFDWHRQVRLFLDAAVPRTGDRQFIGIDLRIGSVAKRWQIEIATINSQD